MVFFTKNLIYNQLFLIVGLLFFSKYLFAQETTMFDESFSYHYYEDDNRIDVKRVEKLLSNDSIANLHWKRAKLKNLITNSFLISEFGLITIFSTSENPKTSVIAGIGTLVSLVGTLVFGLSRQKSRRKAILKYNRLFDSTIQEKKSTSLKITPSLIQSNNQKSLTGIALSLKW